MSTFTVPADTASGLSQLKERTELRDPQGKVIGIFTPQALEHEPLWSQFDLEEAERTLAEQRHAGRPLAEIWRDIRGREPSA